MVNTILCNEFCMIASFDDFSSLDHDDVISVFHGLESVSDDDDSSSLEKSIQCLGDLLFTEGVEC